MAARSIPLRVALTQLPLLNIDSLIIPSPYIIDKTLDIDYEHSLVWDEKKEQGGLSSLTR